jgi:uncharacterized protein (TIGR02145 family)
MKKTICFLAGVLLVFSIHSCKKEDPDLIVKDELNGDGTFIYEGRTYVYKMIAGVNWMIENLACLPSVTPCSVGSGNTPKYYVYGYEGSSVLAAKATNNYKTYGVLYNVEAAKTACPPGWHLPSESEWRLMFYLLFSIDLDYVNNPWIWGTIEDGGTYMGWHLKSTTGWLNDNNGVNTYGFTGIPAGVRSQEVGLYGLGTYTAFWTSTFDSANQGWVWGLLDSPGRLYHTLNPPADAHSIRCVQD